jgi:hypothetical protein
LSTNTSFESKTLPVNVHEALEAICGRGKGRCWYCDKDLPSARRAIRQGWDVQRLEDHAVASIILVCPDCKQQDQASTGEAAEGARCAALRKRARRPLTSQAFPAPAAIK